MRWIWPVPWQMSQVTGHGAGLAARAVAGLAQHGGVDLEVALGAEDDLVEVDLHPDQSVLPALLAGAGARGAVSPAEEGLEDVAEAAEVAAAAEARAAPRSYCWRSCGSLSTSYACVTSLNRSDASSLGFTSG